MGTQSISSFFNDGVFSSFSYSLLITWACLLVLVLVAAFAYWVYSRYRHWRYSPNGYTSVSELELNTAELLVCRICTDASSTVDTGELIAPCLCKGSIKFVHRHCLDQWRCTGERAFSTCPTCKFNYVTTTTRTTTLRMYLWVVVIETVLLFMLVESAVYGLSFLTRHVDSFYNYAMRNEFPETWDSDVSDHLVAWFVFLIALGGFILILATIGGGCYNCTANNRRDECSCPHCDNCCLLCYVGNTGNGDGGCESFLFAGAVVVIIFVLVIGLFAVFGGIIMIVSLATNERLRLHRRRVRVHNDIVTDFNGKELPEQTQIQAVATSPPLQHDTMDPSHH